LNNDVTAGYYLLADCGEFLQSLKDFITG